MDTKFCNDVSFSYWPPIPRNVPSSPCDAKRKPCLSQETRQTANDLSIEVNRMLAAAVQRVNAEKGPKVHFIDPNPAFNGHRFCEVDDGKEVVEPNPDRADTWFFLSEWHDNKLDGGIAAAAEDIDPTLGNENANTTAIPPHRAFAATYRIQRTSFSVQLLKLTKTQRLLSISDWSRTRRKYSLVISARTTSLGSYPRDWPRRSMQGHWARKPTQI